LIDIVKEILKLKLKEDKNCIFKKIYFLFLTLCEQMYTILLTNMNVCGSIFSRLRGYMSKKGLINMFYYTKDGTEISYNYDKNDVISGTQGSVYRVGTTICLKKYSDDTNNKSVFDDVGTRFNQGMFDYFKDSFGGTNFCELYDLLYDKRMVTVLGYTMKYYEEMVENILNMPVSYILDNFSLIYDMVMKLTDECVRIVDMHYGNIINTDNGMIVIDYDKYCFDYESSKETLSYVNKSALIFTFCGIFKNSLMKMGIDVDKDIELKNRLFSLFTVGITPLVLKYKLRSYNSMFDYFVKSR